MTETAIHLPQEKRFEPQFIVTQTVSYGVFADGQAGALRLVTDDGDVLQLIVPTVQIEGMITALRQAKNAAIARQAGAEQPDNKTIFTPHNYATIVTKDYPGVLLAFDRDTPSELLIGLDTNSAKNIGMDLRKQARHVEARPKLIVPARG